jgi:sulfate permease, SulP family
MLKNTYPHLPILNTLRDYSRSFFRLDLFAGATVAAIAIPQAMAYAQLAGAPVAMGLYATFIGMLLFAIFSTTKHVVVGPDAAMAALTGATLIPLANGDPSHYIALVALLAILIGLACLIAVVAKLSFLSEFLSRPILLGYMTGLGLAVIASQAPKLFGLAALAKSNFFSSIFNILSNIIHVHPATLLLSVSLGFACFLMIRFLPKVPVSLVVLLSCIFLSWLLNFKGLGIAVVGTIPSGLPIPRLPDVSFFDVQNLFIPAFAIMMVSYANTITTARSFAAKNNDHINSAQELTALGISSIGTGLFGGIPIAASGVRTAVNEQNKAASQVSQLIAAGVVGLALLFFTPILKYLPQPALAVIIILAVLKLFNIRELQSIWHAWRAEALLAIATVLGVTILGIFQGLLLAILLAVVNLVRKSAFPTDAVLGVAADGSIRDKKRPPKTESIPGIIMYRFDAPLYFGNSEYFRQRVLNLVDATDDIRWFLWDAETITSIDSTAGAMLLGLIREMKDRKIIFCISRLKGPVRSTINRTNRLSNAFKSIPHYPSMGKALAAFEQESAHIDKATKLVKQSRLLEKP